MVRMTQLRVLIVGAGNAARLWLRPALGTPKVEVVAVVDEIPERAAALLAEQDSRLPVYGSLPEALSELSPGLVVDLTPPGSRRAVAEPAFAAGCDVIAEKPLAETVAEAGRLIELADRHGRRLAVMQNRRFHPAMRRLRELAAGGELGDLTLVSCDLHRAVDAFGRLAEHPAPLLSDMAIHEFDQARYLVGADPLRVVTAQSAVPGSGWSGATVAACTFEFPGGVLFSYRGSWASAGLESTWFAAWRLDGREAAASWDGDRSIVMERLTGHTDQGPQFARAPVELGEGTNDHPASVPALLRAMARPGPLETDAHDNLTSLAMVEAAIESARCDGWVEIADVLSRARPLAPPSTP
jgi:predicted dehydrogenase